ncbi:MULTISPECIES: DUF3846 domain-containing protein [Rhodococcus]|uniref:DUF3846 domain-containing protein n=1 Tax=Rhodococcus TaxID=1827 RepID=UPI0009EE9528|nr:MULTISPECIES: DUF3846 domain-containing protein [Rhodococcus]QOH56205.1 DUF3846 domain-containing protein [Rhodococcus rhodochrous]
MRSLVQVIVIPADPQFPAFKASIEKGDYRAYQKVVGGPFECIDLDNPNVTLFCNEEGKLIGGEFNPRATTLLWTSTPVWRGRDVICGDVVLAGQPDDEGSTTSVPEELITDIFRSETFLVEHKDPEDGEAELVAALHCDYWAALFEAIHLIDARRWEGTVRVVAA